MQDDAALLKKLIAETSAILNLGRDIIEKDFYVTKIIHALSEINDNYYKLVFHGGTCLAKAYNLTSRMSEDCDFRIQEKTAAKQLSRTVKRARLRDFRFKIIDAIKTAEFDIGTNDIQVSDEGRFINFQIKYQSIYTQSGALKPFIAADCFVDAIKTPTFEILVTTLIQKTLGNDVNHPSKQITCISIIETAAEKWVGLTRRIATIKDRSSYNDPTLVRHIYDLYKIKQHIELGSDFNQLINLILKTETKKFKTQNANYFKDPLSEILKSFHVLQTSEWKDNWDKFVSAMVFEASPPSYEEALYGFLELSQKCINELKTIEERS